jgi:hypothetical protein
MAVSDRPHRASSDGYLRPGSRGESPKRYSKSVGATRARVERTQTARCRLTKVSEIPLTVRASGKADTGLPEYFCANPFFHFLARIRSLSITLHNL